MGAQTTTNYAQVLKEFYVDPIRDGINQRTEGLDLFKKQGMEYDVGGKYSAFPFHYGRNSGTGSVGNSKTLPVAGNQVFAQVQVAYKNTYGRMQLEGQVMKQSQSARMAFAKAMEYASKNLIKDVARERERQLFGYGVGILCRVNGGQSSGTTINIKDPGGVVGTVGAGRYLKVNDYVVFVRNATPTSAADTDIVSGSSAVQVSSIATDGSSVTFGAATGATLNDNDMVVLSPAQINTESAINREINGMTALVDDSTYITTLNNVSRTTVPQFKSFVKAINGDWSTKDMQLAESTAYENFGPITHILSHVSVRDVYLEKCINFKRFTNEGNLRPDLGVFGGMTEQNVKWNNHEWRPCRMAPYGMVFGVNADNLHRYVNCDGEFIEDYGEMLIPVANQDAVEARYRVYDQFHHDIPNSAFRLDGINADVNYVQAA